MSDHRCVICARRNPADGWTVCRICLGRIDDDLFRIDELVTWAAMWLTPSGTNGNGTRTVPGSRPPLRIDALDASMANDVLPLLESWERLVRESHQLTPYGPSTAAHGASVGRSVGFLRSWLAKLAEEADFPIEVMAKEVAALRWGGELPTGHAVGLEHLDPDTERPDGLRVPCTAPHPDNDGRDCGYRLLVTSSRMGDDLECRRCGNITTAGRLILTALNDPTVIVWAYAEVIADTLGIPERTLQRWGADGTIRRRGTQYDVGAAFRHRVAT